jgi:hypothetical protein
VIEGWIGRPGAGKTYTLTERALVARKRGVEVFANYPIDGCWLFTPEQLLDLPPGLIIIDEAHLWFSARQAMSLPPSWLAEMSQTRKNGWNLIWSAQHEARVDRVIRDITNWMWLTTAWFKHNGHPLFFKTTSWEPEFFRNERRKMVTKWSLFDPRVAGAYDTHAKLTVAAHAERKSDPYRKAAG